MASIINQFRGKKSVINDDDLFRGRERGTFDHIDQISSHSHTATILSCSTCMERRLHLSLPRGGRTTGRVKVDKETKRNSGGVGLLHEDGIHVVVQPDPNDGSVAHNPVPLIDPTHRSSFVS